jgi:hypothetical protein
LGVTSNTVDHLMEVVNERQVMSKTEATGVIVVDSDLTSSASTITRRGGVVDEVLDLGGESWVAGSSFTAGSVLINGSGGLAVRIAAQSTFQLKRYPSAFAATDVAAGNTFALVTGGDGTLLRAPYAAGGHTKVPLSPAPAGLTGVCRAGDTEWYVVGKGGVIFSYDGAMAKQMTSPTASALSDVDCPSAAEAVACGTGVVLVLKGGTWSPLANVPQGNITQCRLSGSTVFIAGPGLFARNVNGSWTTLAAQPTLDGLVVRSFSDAYAASGTSVVHFDGAQWQQVATAPNALVAGFSMGARVVFAGAGGVVLEGQ